jgi:hypothetical protein
MIRKIIIILSSNQLTGAFLDLLNKEIRKTIYQREAKLHLSLEMSNRMTSVLPPKEFKVATHFKIPLKLLAHDQIEVKWNQQQHRES